MGRDEDMLDVFGFGGRILEVWSVFHPSLHWDLGGWRRGLSLSRSHGVAGYGLRTLILVAPFTDFSKELDML